MLIIDDDNDLENNDKYNILDLRGNSNKNPKNFKFKRHRFIRIR